MNDNNPPANWPDRAIGVGAALASALLFAASTRGSSLALALAYFTPLPLLIGAFGFSLLGAVVGAMLGAMLLSHLGQPLLGVAFFLAFAAPSLIVAAVAQREIPARDNLPDQQNPGQGNPAKALAPQPRHFGPGVLLAVALALSTLAAWAGVAALTAHFHGFDAALKAMLAQFGPSLDEVVKELRKMSPDVEADAVKRLILLATPAGVAASQTLLLAVNLWLAGRTVEVSGRLGRPWPDLPENLVLPRLIAPIFVIAAGVSFDGGLVGALAGALAAACGLCLAIQGLAAIHAFSRELRLRGFMLAALYAFVFALEPWSLMALALFGLVESVLSLRVRKERRRLSIKTENT